LAVDVCFTVSPNRRCLCIVGRVTVPKFKGNGFIRFRYSSVDPRTTQITFRVSAMDAHGLILYLPPKVYVIVIPIKRDSLDDWDACVLNFSQIHTASWLSASEMDILS
jgi:hypothetical protein